MSIKHYCKLVTGFRLTTVLSASVLAAGCCSQNVRPGEANIFQAACGVSSGQYQRDVEEKQEEASSTRAELQEEQSRSLDLKGKLADTEERYLTMQQELDQLEANNLSLSRQIAALSQNTQEDRDKQVRLQKTLGKLNLDISTLKSKLAESPDVSDQSKLNKLKQEVETLRLIVLEQ